MLNNIRLFRTTSSDEHVIEKAIKLSDANRKTLGFIPKEGIAEKGRNGDIYACTQDDELLGYILYTHLKIKHVIKIHHFCVDKNFRNSGLAKKIFDSFKKSIHNAYYIELSCRDDYGLSGFWNSLGFRIINTRPGRATVHPSTLQVYRYSLQKSIHDIIEEESKKVKIALDSCIIFSQTDSDLLRHKEFDSLMELRSEIDFCISPHVFDEIARQKDPALKQASLSCAHIFSKMISDHDVMLHTSQEIQKKFSTVNDDDARQLSYTVTSKTKYFITRDEGLLKIANEFMSIYDTTIYSPAELIININSILEYDSQNTDSLNLPTLHARLENITLNENELAKEFLNHGSGEKRSSLISVIRENAHHSALKSITIDNINIGFILYSIKSNSLNIHLLRFKNKFSNLTKLAAGFLIEEIIRYAASEKCFSIVFYDSFSSNDIKSALTELGFHNGIKIILTHTDSIASYKIRLTQIADTHDTSPFIDIIEKIGTHIDVFRFVGIEKYFFPAKFSDLKIPSYIIPIKPKWARDLLTPIALDQYTLLQSERRNVLMNLSNVYYSHTKRHIHFPARILWHVSYDKSTSISKIIAASYLDETHKGPIKDLFKRFARIGVYKWLDLSAKGHTTGTAHIFSRTEIFKNHIPYSTTKEIVKSKMNKGLTLVTAQEISQDIFFDIYKKGTET